MEQEFALNNLSRNFLQVIITENKGIQKNLLLSVKFDKFTSIKLLMDQFQPIKRSTVIGPSITLQRSIYQS